MTHSVLIVEDDPRFLDIFSGAVRAAGDLLLVGAASDIAQGRQLLDEHLPDVLLVDLGLPSGSGIELIHHARQHVPQCDCVVITVHGDDDSVLACIAAGATGYLLKDAGDAHIAQQIRVLRSGGSPISPAIARRLLNIVAGRGRGGVQPDQPAEHHLSERELSVLTLTSKGYKFDEIAELLGLSPATVATYVKRVYRKLRVHSKTEAVYEARKLKLLDD